MYLVNDLSLLFLFQVTMATRSPHQETLIDVSDLVKTKAPFKAENDLFNVPLDEKARTGAVPIELEECIISRQYSLSDSLLPLYRYPAAWAFIDRCQWVTDSRANSIRTSPRMGS